YGARGTALTTGARGAASFRASAEIHARARGAVHAAGAGALRRGPAPRRAHARAAAAARPVVVRGADRSALLRAFRGPGAQAAVAPGAVLCGTGALGGAALCLVPASGRRARRGRGLATSPRGARRGRGGARDGARSAIQVPLRGADNSYVPDG